VRLVDPVAARPRAPRLTGTRFAKVSSQSPRRGLTSGESDPRRFGPSGAREVAAARTAEIAGRGPGAARAGRRRDRHVGDRFTTAGSGPPAGSSGVARLDQGLPALSAFSASLRSRRARAAEVCRRMASGSAAKNPRCHPAEAQGPESRLLEDEAFLIDFDAPEAEEPRD